MSRALFCLVFFLFSMVLIGAASHYSNPVAWQDYWFKIKSTRSEILYGFNDGIVKAPRDYFISIKRYNGHVYEFPARQWESEYGKYAKVRIFNANVPFFGPLETRLPQLVIVVTERPDLIGGRIYGEDDE